MIHATNYLLGIIYVLTTEQGEREGVSYPLKGMDEGKDMLFEPPLSTIESRIPPTIESGTDRGEGQIFGFKEWNCTTIKVSLLR